MNSPTYAVRDSATMLRRNLKHMARYPSQTLMLIGLPLVFLLLFFYVFGGTMGAGLPGAPAGDRGDYLTFITPGILVMAVTSVSISTAVSVATDMTGGIIDRFRTMAIAKVSVLTGHVLGAMIQTALALATVFGTAFLLGLETAASAMQWLGLIGLLALLSFAMTWFTVALGLASPNPETASNWPMIFIMLPFVGSGFVPVESIPTGLRWFAEYQPFTPIMDAFRSLLAGSPDGSDALWAINWCVVIGLIGYLWSRRLYRTRAAN
ncbi:ABC transporter permease [Streptomyces sp. TRM43335]|uniref:Transport permease protein n=1 Tax=Streptomyces taklimakanensis TaxID=2569853 RepID=A0A6G2B6P7_9ACTN|nr:ABC transporter permease [Streptomyces taklimakanensis]MTE17582.1 ABC transporter permease [Streptomyces taklimakanensis]